MTTGTAALAENYSAVEAMRQEYGVGLTDAFVAHAYRSAGFQMTSEQANFLQEAKKFEVQGNVNISQSRAKAESQAKIAVFGGASYVQNHRSASNGDQAENAA